MYSFQYEETSSSLNYVLDVNSWFSKYSLCVVISQLGVPKAYKNILMAAREMARNDFQSKETQILVEL